MPRIALPYAIVATSQLSRWITRSQDLSIETELLGDDITVIRLASRWTRALGFGVTAYVVGDLLVDTGFSHAGHLVTGMLEGRNIAAVCCTHHHEDHTGNCQAVASRFSCPIYLHRAGAQWSEGVDDLLFYRRLFWGPVQAFEPTEMLPTIAGRRIRLRAYPTPGHSATHVAFFEEQSETLFVGDLFVAAGASGVMTQENPYALAASLRRMAALEPRRMLNGHGLDLADPTDSLLAKADAVEQAAAEACALSSSGRGVRSIARRVFAKKGRFRDRLIEILTQGEFSRANFVRAAVRHEP